MSLVLLFGSALSLGAATPQTQLQQAVSQLQASPDDQALREKIIKLARKVKPATPDEYVIQVGKAKKYFKDAQSPDDFLKAVEAFRAASLLAPWKGDLYYNLGLAEEKAGRMDDAVKCYKIYLLANPNAKDKDAVLEKIGSAEATAESQDALSTLYEKLKAAYEGVSYRYHYCSYLATQGCLSQNKMFPCGCDDNDMNGSNWYTPNNKTFPITFPGQNIILVGYFWPLRGTLKSGDMKDIVWEIQTCDNCTYRQIWAKVYGPGECDGCNGLMDKILFSMGNMTAPYHPLVPADFNPGTKYDYTTLYR